MTEKLYYQSAYVKEFSARVVGCEMTDGGYDTVLDRTAFFPEDGAQSADHGYIAASRVLDVWEECGVIHHLTDTPADGEVRCTIDFAERFDKMQCHTAEHIICGIIHKRWGYDNVGFHLGDDEVVFDINHPLDRRELDEVEAEANRIVFENREVRCYFPTPDELSAISYRSKLDTAEGVRIVEIDGVDLCACCAPHVARTGEVGLIKLTDFFKHRGGVRITLVAGTRAYLDYSEKCVNARRISAMLSAPQSDIADVLQTYVQETEEQKRRLAAARRALTDTYAMAIPETDGSIALFYPDLSYDELRDLANSASGKVSGMLALLSGQDGEYKYVILSDSRDMGTAVREVNSALLGKGGGRGRMVQGTMRSSAAEIKKYFNNHP